MAASKRVGQTGSSVHSPARAFHMVWPFNLELAPHKATYRSSNASPQEFWDKKRNKERRLSSESNASGTDAIGNGAKPIRRALLSVTDKSGLVEFAQALSSFGVELISTGGTAKALREAGLAVKDISELTDFPEMLDGRVKTLHPRVHGGLLYIRGNAEHEAAVAAHDIQPIDMVVVNLYAFEKTAAKPGVAFEELIENIDIGGPSMIRSAAKNFRDVAVVTSPGDYEAIAGEMAQSGGGLSAATKWHLAQKAFSTTAAYDSAIASTLEHITAEDFAVKSNPAFPSTLRLA